MNLGFQSVFLSVDEKKKLQINSPNRSQEYSHLLVQEPFEDKDSLENLFTV